MFPFVPQNPFYLIYFVTSRCNARCSFCLNRENFARASKPDELTPAEIENFLKHCSPIRILSITGGEPMLRPDLAEIIKIFHSKAGVRYLGLHTNGFLPQRLESVLLEILPLNVSIHVCLSIDGRDELHDKMRGVKGGLSKVRDCICLLKDMQRFYSNLEIVSGTMFTRQTEDTVADTHCYVREELAINNFVILVRPEAGQNYDCDLDKYLDFYNKSFRFTQTPPIFSLGGFKHGLDRMTPGLVHKLAMQGKRKMNCVAGRSLCVLYDQGDLYPCEYLKQSFGNIRDVNYDWRHLLASERAKEILLHVHERKCSCTWDNILPFNVINTPSCYFDYIKSMLGFAGRVKAKFIPGTKESDLR